MLNSEKYYDLPEEDEGPDFQVDTKVAKNNDVMVTVGNKSFYFECWDGKVVVREYDLISGIPVDDEGKIIFEEKYS